MKKHCSRFRQVQIFVLLFLAALTFTACVEQQSAKPTPEAYKRFLKLRGYEFNETAFLKAVAANDVSAVDGFISAGINSNAKDPESGATALIIAATRDEKDIANLLLKGKADVNLKDNFGYSAILRALQKQNYEIVDLLLDQPGIDLNVQAPGGTTVLMSYVWREQNEVVKRLLSAGANPNLSDGDGDTPLHAAAQRGSAALTTMLLEAGADPNSKNKLGGTPLMWAGSYGRQEVASLLIAKGADASLKDQQGMTAAAWAAKNKQDDVAKHLQASEKKH